MNRLAPDKRELDTPCLVLDIDLLEVNLQRMQALADGSGKALRPHAKTHKCSALARKQIETGAIGICVAKVSEAERLVHAGIDRVLITGPVATRQKMTRLVALRVQAPSLMTVIDHHETARDLAAALRAAGVTLDVLLDVDVGLHRTGVQPANAAELAAAIRRFPELRLRGIQAYAGHVQHIRDYAERRQASLDALRPAAALFRELRKSVPDLDVFSAAGTGTADIDVAIHEVTELQVGSYVCMDAEYEAIGSAADAARFTTFEPALRLLTSVVSVCHDGFVTVDAGLKALYQDGGRPQVFGEMAGGWQYDWWGDEYGKLTAAGSSAPPRLGAVIELIPSHCDPTVNLFDRFHLVRGDTVVGEWPIDLRGCCQ